SRDILASSVSAGLATVITFPAGLARFARAGGSSARSVAAGSGPAAAGSARPGSVASGPVSVASGPGSGLGPLETLLMLVLGPVAVIVVRLAVTREREYR